MLGLCQLVIDVVLGAGVFEGVRPNEFSGDISWFATSIPSRNFTPRRIFGK